MAIDSIIIRNYQGHRKLAIKLGRITTIIGRSDSGKSAILRAFEWVCTNRPAGTSFIRVGAETTTVTVGADEHTIIRTRGKSVNTYALDGQKLEAFGSDVPDAVKQLLNVADINFQSQYDSPLWFAESAGEVSRRLNEIVDLGSIDDVLSRLGSQIRETQSVINLTTLRYHDAKTERKRLSSVEDMDTELKHIEALETQATEYRSQAAVLRSVVREGCRYGSEAKNAVRMLQTGKSTVQAGEVWEELTQQRDKLADMVESAKTLAVQAGRVIPDLSPVQDAADRWQESLTSVTRLSDSIEEARRATDTANKAREVADDLEAKFRKTFGKECPLCGKPVQSSPS